MTITRRGLGLLPVIVAALFGILPIITPDRAKADAVVGARATEQGLRQTLPVVLNRSDIVLYRQIFAVQEDGKWDQADALISKLDNDILMGHVLFQRYMHPTAYRSRYKELKNWMAKYADHPNAARIYKLALRRRPSNWRMPVAPKRLKSTGEVRYQPTFSRNGVPGKSLSAAGRRKARTIRNRIKRTLRRGHTLTAKRIIKQADTKKYLSAAQYDEARTLLAKGYFIDGRDDWALEWALPALKRSGKYLPEGHWTAGLVLWRAERHADAARHFEAAAANPGYSTWLTSASAFWAARAHMVAGNPGRVIDLLEQAASHPRTFYGLLATRLLGRDMPFEWEPPALSGKVLARLRHDPRGMRAIALMQLGDNVRAEAELRELTRAGERTLLEGIHALAARGHMASLAVRLDTLLFPNGGGYDGAAYPIPEYIPTTGFTVDKALVYALIRQESRFNPRAKSWAGARGLMQLMPGTARFVARASGISLHARSKLYTPETNLELGQHYIEMLLEERDVSQNLFNLAVAWNGGPGNLRKWKRRTKHLDDPIFFIESIPSFETRSFVERVLSNFWIYRHRLGQPTPSLDAVAKGEWPLYIAMGHGDSEIASNASRD